MSLIRFGILGGSLVQRLRVAEVISRIPDPHNLPTEIIRLEAPLERLVTHVLDAPQFNKYEMTAAILGPLRHSAHIEDLNINNHMWSDTLKSMSMSIRTSPNALHAIDASARIIRSYDAALLSYLEQQTPAKDSKRCTLRIIPDAKTPSEALTFNFRLGVSPVRVPVDLEIKPDLPERQLEIIVSGWLKWLSF